MPALFRTLAFALLFCRWEGIASAEVRVAFFELHNRRGETIQLEPGGKFAHVAISQQSKWAHAHPLTGVEYLDEKDFSKFGTLRETLVLSGRPDIQKRDLAPFLGKPYDFHFLWSDESIYCSELVAKLLHIDPEPMDFSAKAWEKSKVPKGELGLSPDDLYRILKPEAD